MGRGLPLLRRGGDAQKSECKVKGCCYALRPHGRCFGAPPRAHQWAPPLAPPPPPAAAAALRAAASWSISSTVLTLRP